MNKLFNIYDKDEEDLLKERLIDYSKIPREHVNFMNIYYKDNHYIHTIIIDDMKCTKPNLVFLHGLGASSILYYKLFNDLIDRYTIYAIDLPGLGW